MPGIITIFAALIPFAIWLWKLHVARQSDPKTQNANRYAIIDSDIARGDAARATLHATADLDELERLQNSRNSASRPS